MSLTISLQNQVTEIYLSVNDQTVILKSTLQLSVLHAGFLLRISLAGTMAFIAGSTRLDRITMRHFFNGFRIISIS